ncbi:MAG TPA: hypothetical protein VJQ55_00755 [Candidatus Binatia bacterium]|nr:hypothetical protein [Candidatus Binatia bacterium]
MRAGIRSFIAVAALTASATLTLVANDARAASPAVCEGYTKQAMAQVEEMKATYCELPGGRWSSNPQEHAEWCARATQADIDRQQARRAAELKSCRHCTDYSVSAEDSALAATAYSCGFNGGGWELDAKQLFKWCMANESVADASRTQRKAAVQKCQAEFSREQLAFCEAYANTALQQVRVNRRAHCESQGLRWTSSFSEHMRWCTLGFRFDPSGKTIRASAKEEERWREIENGICQDRIAGIEPPPVYGGVAPKKDPNMLDPEVKDGSAFGQPKQRPSDNKSKAQIKPQKVAVPRSKSTLPAASAPREKPAAISESAMDRLAPGATSASGGSYKSKDGAPAQTRSSGGGGAGSGGAGTPSGGFVGPNLRMSPGTGNIKQDKSSPLN